MIDSVKERGSGKCSDLLIEIGTEELPPKALKSLSEAFRENFFLGLDEAHLGKKDDDEIKSYASPRRLALLIKNLAERAPDRMIEKHGPALTAAFDEEGSPTKAAEGFARSVGVSVDQLDNKDGKLFFARTEKGRSTTELIPDIVRNALEKLPIPKRMRWGDLDAQFVRPVHWIVLLFGNKVIDTEILSVKSGQETRGHRFHHPENIYIEVPDEYEQLLETQGHVVASFNDRRKAVHAQVVEAGKKLGGKVIIDENLLDEVTAMVEWPHAIAGNFEKHFLDVPAEALISTMKTNQKYFHVVDNKGNLMPHFITVANIDSKNEATVRDGNERVIRPRLSDAEFFWTQDRKHKLESYSERLKSIVFQEKLGTLYDKSERTSQLAGLIAESIGANKEWAQRAAWLSKCDLVTEMVSEFPGLQGIMGRYYASHDKEPGEVALAMEEQYMPRFAGDELPATATGQALAIADKLDTVVGIFGIGQSPTGSKDPYALRRSALGILRIIIECQLPVDLYALIESAKKILGKKIEDKNIVEEVNRFMLDRLHAYYSDLGVTPDVLLAVVSRERKQPYYFDRRVRAVDYFLKLPEAESLAAANKRITNILRQALDDGLIILDEIDESKLVEEAERALADQISSMTQKVTPLFDKHDYEKALSNLAGLREAVDNFFDDVMVMTEDEALRDNRLALLNQLRNLFLHVADLSALQY